MLIERRAVGPFFKNGFVAACERTGEAVLIDPGDEVEDLLAIVSSHRLTVRHILLTHAHFDHITGVGRAKEVTGAPVWLHPDDEWLYENAPGLARAFGLTVARQPPIDSYYAPGTRLRFGDLEVRVHHTPGHCPGGVCLQAGPAGEDGRDLFVGDTLFAGSIGRTDLPGGDFATLIRSIRDVLFPLGDDCIVYPGHGEPTTIGEERRTNPFLQ